MLFFDLSVRFSSGLTCHFGRRRRRVSHPASKLFLTCLFTRVLLSSPHLSDLGIGNGRLSMPTTHFTAVLYESSTACGCSTPEKALRIEAQAAEEIILEDDWYSGSRTRNSRPKDDCSKTHEKSVHNTENER